VPYSYLDDLPAVFTIGSTGSDDFQGGAEVRFITLETKTMFDKVQSRSGGVAKQRVCDGIVQMEARSPVGQILGIKVWVFRAKEAAELHKDRNGPVQLPVMHGQHNIGQVCYVLLLCRGTWGRVTGTRRKKGAGNIPRVAGSGRNRKKYTTLRNILRSKKSKEAEAN